MSQTTRVYFQTQGARSSWTRVYTKSQGFKPHDAWAELNDWDYNFT
jgi:hypothetical protein